MKNVFRVYPILIVVLVLFFHSACSGVNNERYKKTLTKFVDALIDQDLSSLKKVMLSENDFVNITGNFFKGNYADYLKKNSDAFIDGMKHFQRRDLRFKHWTRGKTIKEDGSLFIYNTKIYLEDSSENDYLTVIYKIVESDGSYWIYQIRDF